MQKTKIKVIVDGDTFEFNNLLCSGAHAQDEDNPTAMYFGHLDVGEMGVNLMYMLRSLIKIQRKELGIPLDVSKEFVLECLAEAMRRERFNRDDQTVFRRVFDQN